MQYVEFVYEASCHSGIYDRGGAPYEDGWGVVISAQSLIHTLLPQLCSALFLQKTDPFQYVCSQTLHSRQVMAAAVVLAMRFHKAFGLSYKVFFTDCNAFLPGEAAVYYQFFLTPCERQQIIDMFWKMRGAVAIRGMVSIMEKGVFNILSNHQETYKHCALNVLHYTEEDLYARLGNAENFYNARGVANFLLRAATRCKSDFVLCPENRLAAAGAALAGACAVHNAPTQSNPLPSEREREIAIEFVRIALAASAEADGLFTGRYAAGEEFHALVTRDALQSLLHILRCSPASA